MLINEKISELQNLIKRKITKKEVADVLGLGSSQAVINRVTRKQPLADYEILKLDDYFKNELNKSNQNAILNKGSDSEPYILGDYYPDVFGSCGGGAFVLSETKERIKIPEKCFIKPISRVKKYSVIQAVGSSMAPYLIENDRLIVEHFENGDKIQDDKVYVFCYDDQIFVKRLYYNVDEIIVKSDNPDPIFKVKYISKENMKNLLVIGQIVGIMRDCR